MRFRPKSRTIVEAEQYWCLGMEVDGVCHKPDTGNFHLQSNEPIRPHIHRPAGIQEVKLLDWIVRSVDGQCFAYGPFTFANFYQPADSQEAPTTPMNTTAHPDALYAYQFSFKCSKCGNVVAVARATSACHITGETTLQDNLYCYSCAQQGPGSGRDPHRPIY